MRRPWLIAMLLLSCSPAAAQLWPWNGPGAAPWPSGGGSSFVSLASSDWGTGATNDLTGRIATYRPFVKPDTSGWTNLTMSVCSEAELNAQIALLDGSGQNIVMPSGCTITVTGADGTDHFTALDHDNARILGDGTQTIHVDWGSGPLVVASGQPGVRERGFFIGKTVSTIATWSLDPTTLTFGATKIAASVAITDLYPTDVVYITFTGGSNQGTTTVPSRFWRRVTCARWSDGTVHGTGCDTSDPLNTIVIDDGLKINMSGTDSYQMGTFSSQQIVHVERKGGGTLTDNITENFGIEGITISHSAGDAVRDSGFVPIYFNGCFNCWVEDVTSTSWGTSRITFNAGGRYRIADNIFKDALWKPRCTVSLVSLTDTTPVTVTLNTTGASDSCDAIGSTRWGGGGGTETMVYFHPDVNEPLLAGKTFYYTNSGGGPTTLGGDVTLTLPNLNGTGSMNTSATGGATNLNQYNVATMYIHGGISGVEVYGNAMVNTRVGVIVQGGDENFIGYNYIWTEANNHCSRAIFQHGGGMSVANLYEGNATNCALVPYAKANASRDGEGPYPTWFRNRAQNGSLAGFDFSHQCSPQAALCVEQTSQNGASHPFSNYLANVIPGFVGGGNFIDNRSNLDNGSDQSPGQLYASFWGKNLYTDGTDADAMFEPNPPGGYGPTEKPDVDLDDANEAAVAPPAWASFAFPTSLYFSSSDLTNGAPPGWCSESGTFPSIGADVDDTSGTLSKIPAQIRYEGGTCTKP